jgi:hypothetical protein
MDWFNDFKIMLIQDFLFLKIKWYNLKFYLLKKLNLIESDWNNSYIV